MIITKKIQSVTCDFTRVSFGEQFAWYCFCSRRRKETVGGKIKMVTHTISGNSLWGEDNPRSERHNLLRSGTLPEYKLFEHVFQDFCLDTEDKMRQFL